MTKIALLLFNLITVFAYHTAAKVHPAIKDFNDKGALNRCKTVNSGRRCIPALHVRWLEWKPFISRENNEFKGIFPSFMKALNKSCTDGCKIDEAIGGIGFIVSAFPKTYVTIQYEQEVKSHAEMMEHIKNESENFLSSVNHTRLYLPVPVTESYQSTVHGFPFIFSYYFKELLFLERKVKGDMVNLIFQGFLNSWELFAVVVLLAGLFGMLIWIVERKRNKEIPNDFLPGAGTGFWLAFVTMTTVGYGDKTPKTIFGRILFLIWMMISLCLFPLLMANFTNLITDVDVHSLYGVKVGVERGGAEAKCALKESADIREYNSKLEVINALAEKEVDGALFEKWSGTFLKQDIERKNLRIARAFNCDLRIGAVGVPKYNDKKRLIEMIRKLNGMDQDCLPGLPRSDCKAQIAGKSLQEAINFPPPTAKGSDSNRFTMRSPLIICGATVGTCFALGLVFQLFQWSHRRFNYKAANTAETKYGNGDLHGMENFKETGKLKGKEGQNIIDSEQEAKQFYARFSGKSNTDVKYNSFLEGRFNQSRDAAV